MVRMQFPYAQLEKFTVELVGCLDGVGVGLDVENRVDMLVPGKPAASKRQMGDRIVTFDGVSLFDGEQQRKLKDVVKPAASHTLLIERARSPTMDGQLRRDPMVPAELNVDNDKEEALLFGALGVTLLAFVVSQLGTFSEWVPR